MKESYDGPTWADVAALVQEIRETWKVSVDVTLTPPCPIPGASYQTSWRVTLRVWGPGLKGLTVPTDAFVNTFGRGGSARSAPAALHHALSRLWECLDGQLPAGNAHGAGYAGGVSGVLDRD